jgi:hypothetical protein
MILKDIMERTALEEEISKAEAGRAIKTITALIRQKLKKRGCIMKLLTGLSFTIMLLAFSSAAIAQFEAGTSCDGKTSAFMSYGKSTCPTTRSITMNMKTFKCLPNGLWDSPELTTSTIQLGECQECKNGIVEDRQCEEDPTYTRRLLRLLKNIFKN